MSRDRAKFTPERVLAVLGIGVVIAVVAIAIGGKYSGAAGAVVACLIGSLLGAYWRRDTNRK
jgi:membrane associated rhomboid family serine protease